MRLVPGADVLLSALIGGRAEVALPHPSVQGVYAAAATLDEVHAYMSVLARKKRLPLDVLLLALAALPVVVVERADYERKVSRRPGGSAGATRTTSTSLSWPST